MPAEENHRVSSFGWKKYGYRPTSCRAGNRGPGPLQFPASLLRDFLWRTWLPSAVSAGWPEWGPGHARAGGGRRVCTGLPEVFGARGAQIRLKRLVCLLQALVAAPNPGAWRSLCTSTVAQASSRTQVSAGPAPVSPTPLTSPLLATPSTAPPEPLSSPQP